MHTLAALSVMLLYGGIAAPHQDFNRAMTLLDDWQLEEARDIGQKLLVKDPDNPRLWMLAGRILHQLGQHETALTMLNAARRAGIATHYIQPRVEGSAAYAAHFQWLKTKHFRIAYLNKDEIVAQYAAPVLEMAYHNIGRSLDMSPHHNREKIAVEIYPDARGLAAATGLTVGEIATSGTIAVCKFHRLMIISPLATANGYPWADTLAHELVHLMISKKSHNRIPIWLHEGIAKYYESLWRSVAGKALEPHSEKLLAEAVRNNDLVTYDEMHPSMAKLPSQEKAALAFAEVFTTIEFLTKRFGKYAIPQVLELAGRGLPLDAVFKQVFGLNLRGIETAWRRYLTKRPFRIMAGAKPVRIILAKNESQPNHAAPLETIDDKIVHDHARLGELLQLRGHASAAMIEYEKAYAKAGVRYVTLTYRLAKAYVSLKRHSDAQKILDASFKVHPQDTDTRLLAGRIAFGAGNNTVAKQHFESVRLRNPFNPNMHRRLATIYQQEGNQEAAEKEEHFFALSQKPRPTRTYERPPPSVGKTQLSVITLNWGDIRIDRGRAINSPVWEMPLNEGPHTIEYTDALKQYRVFELTLRAGDNRRVVLR